MSVLVSYCGAPGKSLVHSLVLGERFSLYRVDILGVSLGVGRGGEKRISTTRILRSSIRFIDVGIV